MKAQRLRDLPASPLMDPDGHRQFIDERAHRSGLESDLRDNLAGMRRRRFLGDGIVLDPPDPLRTRVAAREDLNKIQVQGRNDRRNDITVRLAPAKCSLLACGAREFVLAASRRRDAGGALRVILNREQGGEKREARRGDLLGILFECCEPLVASLIAEFTIRNSSSKRCFGIRREGGQPCAPRVAHSLARRALIKERVDLSTFRLRGIAGVRGHNEVKLEDRLDDRNVNLAMLRMRRTD